MLIKCIRKKWKQKIKKSSKKYEKKHIKNIIKIARPANSIDSQSWVTSENLKHKRILSVGCFFVYIAFFRMLCIHHTFFVFRVFLLSTQTIESKKMNCLPSRVWRTFFCIANVHVERFLLPLQWQLWGKFLRFLLKILKFHCHHMFAGVGTSGALSKVSSSRHSNQSTGTLDQYVFQSMWGFLSWKSVRDNLFYLAAWARTVESLYSQISQNFNSSETFCIIVFVSTNLNLYSWQEWKTRN